MFLLYLSPPHLKHMSFDSQFPYTRQKSTLGMCLLKLFLSFPHFLSVRFSISFISSPYNDLCTLFCLMRALSQAGKMVFIVDRPILKGICMFLGLFFLKWSYAVYTNSAVLWQPCLKQAVYRQDSAGSPLRPLILGVRSFLSFVNVSSCEQWQETDVVNWRVISDTPTDCLPLPPISWTQMA